MIFYQKIKTKRFWIALLRISITFFFILTVISFGIAAAKALFSNDFSKSFNIYLENQNWFSFFGIKLIGAILYGLYTTNKNFK